MPPYEKRAGQSNVRVLRYLLDYRGYFDIWQAITMVFPRKYVPASDGYFSRDGVVNL